MNDDRKRRIAVVGGGPAGLSAAYHLTDQRLHPGGEDVYEGHVYQRGWRVGWSSLRLCQRARHR